MPETTTKAPSFASVLHRLACGEDVSGAELLRLPGFLRVPTSMPIRGCLDYSLIDVPELVCHAGLLAEPDTSGVAVYAALVAGAIRHDEERFGCLEAVEPNMRSQLWQLGAAADRGVMLATTKGT